jgi:hypothetical protein
MKFQKGDLVRYQGCIMIITGIVPTSSQLYYTTINLTPNDSVPNKGKYTTEYIDLMSKKIG